jgi:hypothetical protein
LLTGAALSMIPPVADTASVLGIDFSQNTFRALINTIGDNIEPQWHHAILDTTL